MSLFLSFFANKCNISQSISQSVGWSICSKFETAGHQGDKSTNMWL